MTQRPNFPAERGVVGVGNKFILSVPVYILVVILVFSEGVKSLLLCFEAGGMRCGIS